MDWIAGKSTESDDDNTGILCVEWAKSQARALHAKEEVILFKEEMQQMLAYLEWKADWWKSQQKAQPGVENDLQEALSVYTELQAGFQISLEMHFIALWATPLQVQELTTTSTTSGIQVNLTTNVETKLDNKDQDKDKDNGKEYVEEVIAEEEEENNVNVNPVIL